MNLLLTFAAADRTELVLNAALMTALVCWGLWGILDKKALERSSPLDVFLVMILFELIQIPVLAALLTSIATGWQIRSELWFWAAVSAVLLALNTAAYLFAMARSDASYVLGFTAAYPLVSQVLACIFLNEHLAPERLIGGLLITMGVFAIGLSGSSRALRRAGSPVAAADQLPAMTMQDPPGLPRNPEPIQNTVLLSCVLLATVTWGIKGLIDKVSLSFGTPMEVMFADSAANALILIPLAVIYSTGKHRFEPSCKSLWLYCGLSVLCLAIGGFAYLAALNQSEASYVITISGCYPLLMYVFAVLILKERINSARLLGIALVVGGGILVQLSHHA